MLTQIVSYGAKPRDAANWREKMLAETGLVSDRVHFLGRIAYAQYRTLLQVSAAHVYLTYPFVLSWSMLEAMACGCLLLGSRTAPVEEVVRDGENGRLIDFFAPQDIAAAVVQALDGAGPTTPLRRQAANDIDALYSVRAGNEKYRALVEQLMLAR